MVRGNSKIRNWNGSFNSPKQIAHIVRADNKIKI